MVIGGAEFNTPPARDIFGEAYMEKRLDQMEVLFKALGDVTRLRILGLLTTGEVCVLRYPREPQGIRSPQGLHDTSPICASRGWSTHAGTDCGCITGSASLTIRCSPPYPARCGMRWLTSTASVATPSACGVERAVGPDTRDRRQRLVLRCRTDSGGDHPGAEVGTAPLRQLPAMR